uniref:Uncharacterized protein n=1 Tax=Cyprinus carpio TaxID=7962 RepID=A0A8C2H9J7_CYPCA
LALFTIIGMTFGAAGTVLLALVALGIAGFTGAGIAAGSTAAGMMSSAAIANGGDVAAGSLVALLQSAGIYPFFIRSITALIRAKQSNTLIK